MNKIIIDNQEFEIASLSDDTNAHVESLQFVDHEIIRARALLASLQTARNAYARAIQESLTSAPDKVVIG